MIVAGLLREIYKVCFEKYFDVADAIAREKQLKHWRRTKKAALIGEMNPEWNDLSDGFV